jgi:hypothetical protein
MGYPLKAVSLPARVTIGDVTNAYTDSLVQNYVNNVARCHWVRIWMFWNDIEPSPAPADLWQQWSRYHDGSIPAAHDFFLYYLDPVIATCNSLGIGVLLSMSHYSPTWANGASAPQVDTGKSAWSRFPSTLEVGSPWERFLSYVYNRYRINFNSWTGYYNPTGPNSSNYFGNPSSAWISGLGIVNEPNYQHWQDYDPGCTAAKMMQTMENAIVFWNQFAPTTACAVFAPDMSDTADRWSGGTRYATDYLSATNAALTMLANWRPRVYFVWSHHNYEDVGYQNQSRANNVRNALYSMNWRGGGDRNVWLTEGAGSAGSFSSVDQYVQHAQLNANWNLPHLPEFQMFTQHLVRNKPGTTTGLTDYSGNPLVAYNTFAGFTPMR